MITFISPNEVIEAQKETILKEIKKAFMVVPEPQVVFMENLITLLSYTLAQKRLDGKPLSEEFLRGANEMLVTLNNLKQSVERKNDGY